MAFKYVTAILTDSPNTEFASPSRSSVHATADAIESLRSFAPGVPLVIVFDGITVPQRRMFGSKCGSPVRNASEYLKHIERVRSLAIATMLQSVQIIIAPERGCLVGTAHAGVAAVRTPFVLMMQNDRPLLRRLPWQTLVRTMWKESDHVQAIWLSSETIDVERKNEHRACFGKNAHRKKKAYKWLQGREPLRYRAIQNRSHTLERNLHLTAATREDEGLSLERRRFWSDATVFARIEHYTHLVWPTVETDILHYRQHIKHLPNSVGFMEYHIFCHPYIAWELWGTWTLVDHCTRGPFTAHDLRKKTKQKQALMHTTN